MITGLHGFGPFEAEQDGGSSGWWSRAAHIMTARRGREGQEGGGQYIPLQATPPQ
jgi:hypothetical protein